MLPGLNHNVRFKGKIYHVQTEDSGVNKPHITTILYEGGTILARKRTSYADMVTSDHLQHVVRDLMKNQHKEMLRALKSGRFEKPGAGEVDVAPVKAPEARRPEARRPEGREAGGRRSSKSEPSLDDVILDYLTNDSKGKRSGGRST
jgi:hypothetical protein